MWHEAPLAKQRSSHITNFYILLISVSAQKYTSKYELGFDNMLHAFHDWWIITTATEFPNAPSCKWILFFFCFPSTSEQHVVAVFKLQNQNRYDKKTCNVSATAGCWNHWLQSTEKQSSYATALQKHLLWHRVILLKFISMIELHFNLVKSALK